MDLEHAVGIKYLGWPQGPLESVGKHRTGTGRCSIKCSCCFLLNVQQFMECIMIYNIFSVIVLKTVFTNKYCMGSTYRSGLNVACSVQTKA